MNAVVFDTLPKGWGWIRLKWLLCALESGRREISDTDSYEGEALSIGGEHIGWQGQWQLENPRYVSREFFAEMSTGKIHQNDVLVVKDGATIGKVAIAEQLPAPESAVNEHVFLLRFSPQNHPKFYFYFVQSSLAQDQIQLEVRGSAQPGLNSEFRNSVVAPQPPSVEQRAIAIYLNAETTKLDTLIAKKQELIEKLKEKRTALISRTVTRGLPPEAARAAGLNPNPKLKPSGIEWLDDVPEHWEVKQLKWAIMFQRGHDLPTDDREEGNVPLVTSSGVSATHSVAATKGPGIVTGRYGTIGQFYLVKEDYWPLNTTLYSIDLRGNEPRFLRYMLTHLAPLFLLNAVKSAVPGVDRNDIHPIKAAVPPLPEQRAIADYLDRETAKIDRMVEKVEAAIERLQEYRTALITAAVTGKIDVRKSAA